MARFNTSFCHAVLPPSASLEGFLVTFIGTVECIPSFFVVIRTSSCFTAQLFPLLLFPNRFLFFETAIYAVVGLEEVVEFKEMVNFPLPFARISECYLGMWFPYNYVMSTRTVRWPLYLCIFPHLCI